MSAIGAALATGIINVGQNFMNGMVAEHFQDQYMSRWGSPQAQMGNMMAAGINPYAAALKASGAAGDTNVGSQVGFEGAGEVAQRIADSHMNPTVTANTESDTKKNEADAKSQEMQNEIVEDTLDERKEMVKTQLVQAGLDVEAAQFAVDHQEELFNLNKAKINNDISVGEAQVKLYDEQVDHYKAQIREINEQIRLIRQEVKTSRSVQERNESQAALFDAEKRKVDLEADIVEIEKGRYKAGSEGLPAMSLYYIQKYDEAIAQGMNPGQAHEYAKDQTSRVSDVLLDYTEETAKAESIGSDPWVARWWNLYSHVQTYEEGVGVAEEMLPQYKDALKKAISAKDAAAIAEAESKIHACETVIAQKKEFDKMSDQKGYVGSWKRTGQDVVKSILPTAGSALGLYLGGKAGGKAYAKAKSNYKTAAEKTAEMNQSALDSWNNYRNNYSTSTYSGSHNNPSRKR